jgi:very-short-patch-repair endonuclease
MVSKYLRMAAMALCALGGFVHPAFFIPAAILALSLISTTTPRDFHEEQRPKPESSSIKRVTFRAEDDPDWQKPYLLACESPAESSFLIAMIEGFSLKPQLGVLKGSGLTLDMQVVLGRYRLDFFANRWLVIEIDGAAYHSSPDAVARDEARDAYLESYDYTVLRIPAKIVFSTPLQAVAKVRSALAAGRKVVSQPDGKRQAAAQKKPTLLDAALKFVDDFSAHMERAEQSMTAEKAMAKPRAIFEAEKVAIKIALEHADRQIEVDEFCAQSPENRKNYEENLAFFGAILKDSGNADPKGEVRQAIRERILPIEAPSPHPNPEINEDIKSRHRSLLEDRTEYFEKIRRQLSRNEQVRTLVMANLEEAGCLSCRDAVG